MSQEQANSGGQAELDSRILDDLARSGLTRDTFPIEEVKDKEQVRQRLGFTTIIDEDGNELELVNEILYWVVYRNIPGYYRAKLRREIKTKNGGVRYVSPKGKGNHPRGGEK